MAIQGTGSYDRNALAWKVLLGLGLVYGGIWLVQWWQRPPAVDFNNLKYIQLLRTAVSSERTDWLTKVKQAIDERSEAGEMSDRERAAFDHIIELAEAKEWKAAHAACFEFEVAQLNRYRAQDPESTAHSDAAHKHEHQHDHQHN